MWRTLFLVAVLGCLSLPLALFSGCSLDETEENLTTVQQGIDTVIPYVPTTHTYIPATISAMCTLALSVVRILKERRETQQMKKAIKAKARQIDQVISAPSNPGTSKENPVLTFLRKDKNLADDEKFDALATFDAVRKGYI